MSSVGWGTVGFFRKLHLAVGWFIRASHLKCFPLPLPLCFVISHLPPPLRFTLALAHGKWVGETSVILVRMKNQVFLILVVCIGVYVYMCGCVCLCLYIDEKRDTWRSYSYSYIFAYRQILIPRHLSVSPKPFRFTGSKKIDHHSVA